MRTVGVICEYNPFHLGHHRQLCDIRALCGADSTVVCLMSGNFVQRGHPAVFDKMLRTHAALSCGADLVLELPIPCALSSAEGFADGGVQILGDLCDTLCFGTEVADAALLTETAAALCTSEFSDALRARLGDGLSFPAAREQALRALGLRTDCLQTPNSNLAVEYCKAIISRGLSMQLLPLLRTGDYHDTTARADAPSATALRSLIVQGLAWDAYTPPAAAGIFAGAPVHTLQNGEQAILAKLRSMQEDEFAALPYGSEGLWRKLMHASRRACTLAEIISEVKSRRYTRTRLDRMILCAFLGITEATLIEPVPYVRVLGFNERGRRTLRAHRESSILQNIGQNIAHPYQELERRTTALYGLFCDTPEPPDRERGYRVVVSDVPCGDTLP